MVDVTVVLTNGNVVNFGAQEFDADLVNTMGPGLVNKFPYKDAAGNDSAIHLRPNDVAGLFVTPGKSPRTGERAITYRVASQS